MCSQSSTKPTRNRNEAAPRTTQVAGVCGVSVTSVITAANQIATPPIMAVGFLCQRSVLGLATNPQRVAKALTTGVSPAASAKDTKGGTRLSSVRETINEIGERKLFDHR